MARLGLARVSVVRGEGPLAGQPCVDDYIHLHEPVADHLTRFSGIVRPLPLCCPLDRLVPAKPAVQLCRRPQDCGTLLAAPVHLVREGAASNSPSQTFCGSSTNHSVASYLMTTPLRA